jgi:hypothetical protein
MAIMAIMSIMAVKYKVHNGDYVHYCSMAWVLIYMVRVICRIREGLPGLIFLGFIFPQELFIR